MRLTAGTKLGPYEIVSLVGAGGMGEVYRARDTRLQRDVAIKILPQIHVQEGTQAAGKSGADGADRLRRFEQEAKAKLSSGEFDGVRGGWIEVKWSGRVGE